MEIPVVFAVDDNYAPILAVAIQSLAENSSKNNIYQIYILNEGLSRLHRLILKDICDDFNNVNINFLDVSNFWGETVRNRCYLEIHASLATYYRFFAAKLLSKYSKIIYLDADIIINRDISELFNIDIGDNWLGASKDVREAIAIKKGITVSGRNWKHYVTNELELDDPYGYFQAGVLLINVKAFNENNVEEKCFSALESISKPILSDQDILNHVCKGHIEYIPFAWNIQWQIPFEFKNYEEFLTDNIKKEYTKAFDAPYILHFASALKPWTDSWLPQAECWWFYARKTNLLDLFKVKEILSLAEKYLPAHLEERITHYRRMTGITFGERRNKYQKKLNDAQNALKQLKHWSVRK